jgi:predicted DNA-binding transcriptional regulator AlpA
MGAHQENSDAAEPLLVGVETVAQLISVSTRSVWRLVSAGKLFRPVRVGNAARWPYAQLKRWIELGCPPVAGGDSGELKRGVDLQAE